MGQENLISAIENFAEVRVLCVGDVMLDFFVYGDIERISPEAPIPVVRVQHEECMLGGAGNVVRNLASLGVAVSLVSLTGEDDPGQRVRALLAGLPNCRAVIVSDPGRPTSVKTRYLAQSQQVLRVDSESTEPAGAAHLAQLLEGFEELLRECDVVILSDYGKGVLTGGDSAQRFIQTARAAGKPVLVDPKGRDFQRYAHSTIVKPNRKELAEATALPVADDASVERAARHLIAETSLDAVLVTLGPAGMLLVPADKPARAYRAAAREVFDVSGAGDTVAATLAAGIGSRLSLEDAAEIANLAAGLVVAKIGTAVVTQEQLIRELESHHPSAADDKVMAVEEAVQRARRWRRQGMRVGFTNGCFDLLHAGHIALLRKAREHCDRLIVGINSDRSVTRLKGPGLPAQDEQTRALILASLSPVALVVVFDEETPECLIRELHPDLLVKGADYRPDQVVGANLVAGWGGELLLVDLVPGHSTTRTMQRLAR